MNRKIVYEHDAVPIGYYDKIYKKQRGLQSKWHHQKFNLIKDKIKRNSYHLDFGCSSGTFIGSLNPTIKSIGVDIAKDQIKYAKQNYNSKNKSFKNCKLPLPFKNDYFDVITIIEIVEHCDNKENKRILNELYRVLKPGGILILTTPNYSSLWPILEKIVSIVGPIDYRDQHINRFNKKKLYKFISQKPFKSIKINSFIYFAPFFSNLSWKLSNFVENIEKLFLKLPCGFLLFGVFKK